MNNYHMYEQLGRGKYSVVYKGRKRKSLQYIAIKRLEKARKKKIINQVKHLHQLEHPNVIKLHNWIQSKNHFWMIMEYCPGGDLLQMIEEDKVYQQQTIKSFLKQIVQGLQYIHSKGIIYCDLKPANIMVNQYGNLKLSDFGSARRIVDLMQSDQSAAKKGTPYYMSPQLFENKPIHSFSSDFWALGCIMFQLAQGMPPFISSSFAEIVNLALSSQTPRVQNMSQEFNDLLGKLLQKQPGKRIKWKEMIEHRWWDQIEFENVEMPKQSHFEKYLESNILDKEKNKNVDIIRMSLNIKKHEFKQEMAEHYKIEKKIGKENDVRISNRRESLNFGQSNEEDEEMPCQKIKVQESLNVGVDDIIGLQLVPIEKIMKHHSDVTVKPIIGNRQIEKVQTSTFYREQLPFHYISPQDVINNIGTIEIDNHLNTIISSLQSKCQQKINILNYLQQCIQSDIANYLIKTQLIQLFIKILKQNKNQLLKIKVCQILGLIIRHATVIQPQFIKIGLTNSMIQIINSKEKSDKLKRKAIACLGQFLFYSATQVDQQDSNQIWDLSQSCYNILVKIIKGMENDQIIKFYAIKTIENITAQAVKIGHKFSNVEIINCILLTNQNTKNDLLKLSCAMCYHHLVLLNPSLLDIVLQKLSLKYIMSIFVSMDSNSKLIQILLSLLNISLFQENKFSKLILEDLSLINSVFHLIENSSNVVKSKVILFIWLIVKADMTNWILLTSSKIFQYLQKLVKEGNKYVLQALQHLIILFQESIPQIIKYIEQQLKHYNRSIGQSKFNEDRSRNKTGHISYINVLIWAMNSGVLAKIFNNLTYIEKLFNFLEYCDVQQSVVLNSVKNDLMVIYEGILNKFKIVFSFQEYFVYKLMPSLMQNIENSKISEMLFSYLKIILHLLAHFYGQQYLYSSSKQENILKSIEQTIINKFFSSLPKLLRDREPVPTYCMKVIGLLIDNHKNYIGALKKLNLLGTIIQSYQAQNFKLNQNILRIVDKLVQSNELDKDEIIRYGIILKTINILLLYLHTKQDIFLQNPLSTLLNILIHFLPYRKILDNNDPPFKDSIQLNLQISSDKLVDLCNLLAGFQAHADLVVLQKSTEIISIMMQYGIFPIAKFSVREKRGAKNAWYWQKYGKGKLDKETESLIKQFRL